MRLYDIIQLGPDEHINTYKYNSKKDIAEAGGNRKPPKILIIVIFLAAVYLIYFVTKCAN